MDTFEFDALRFVSDPTAEADVSPGTRQDILSMLACYPELSRWRPSVFFQAWGAYSQDIYAISWVDWLKGQRDPGFLAYCYVRQRWPDFDFGGTGLFDDEIQILADGQPWAQSPLPPIPDWVRLS